MAKTMAERRAELEAQSHEELVALAINEHYNGLALRLCRQHETGLHGKAVPYMGWYWRAVDFASGSIPIAFGEGYVACCANNKWGHDEREMAPEEVAQFVGHLDSISKAEGRGGLLSEINDEVRRRILEMQEWMQTLHLDPQESTF